MVLEELAALGAAIDAVGSLDPVVLAEGDAVLELLAQASRLSRVVARQAVAFDGSVEWVDEGASNSTSWVTAKRHSRRADARAPLEAGRGVLDMPLVDAAWSEGAIDRAHVMVLHAAYTSAKDLFRRDEQLLVGFARSLTFCDFEKAVTYWRQHATPDEVEERAEAQRAQRDVQLASSIDGVWFGRMTLDPVSGEIVAAQLRRIEQDLFDAEWREAKDRLGRRPTIGELPRTAKQRRADALVEMAVRSATAPADGRRPEPLITVLVDYETLAGRVCELASGAVVTPGTVLGLLDRAFIERVVFGPASRVLDVSRRARFFTGATRRAIEVRDRRCTHDLCDCPGDRCQADHIEPYGDGGETVVDNGRLLCGFHNRRRNHHPDEPALTDDDVDPEDDAYEDEALVETDPVSTSDNDHGEADGDDAGDTDDGTSERAA